MSIRELGCFMQLFQLSMQASDFFARVWGALHSRVLLFILGSYCSNL